MPGSEPGDTAADPAPLRLGGHLGLSSPDRPLLAPLGRSAGALDQIEALAGHGFAGVQDLALKLRPADEVEAMAALMARHGLALTCFGGDPLDWNQPLWSRTDAASRARQNASVAASCVLARRFGRAGVVCVTGLDPAQPRAAQLAAMTENLKRVAEPAAAAGLVLLVEPIAEARIAGMLLSELEHGVGIVEAVAMPSVRLLFDTGHAAMMGHEVPAALRRFGPLIGLIQAADVAGRRRVDPGLGTLDWAAIASAVRGIGYTGVIELEFEPVDPTPAGAGAMLARLAAIAA